MKAAIFEKPGLENLKIKHDVEQPKITDHDVLIKVKMAGVNPIDNTTVSGTRLAEYMSVPEKSSFKIPDEMQWELAACLPVTTLTPYHALKQAALKINEFLVIFGALGNTGMIATQPAETRIHIPLPLKNFINCLQYTKLSIVISVMIPCFMPFLLNLSMRLI